MALCLPEIIDDIPEGVNKTCVAFTEGTGRWQTIIYYKVCECGKISPSNKHLERLREIPYNICNGRHDADQLYLRNKQW